VQAQLKADTISSKIGKTFYFQNLDCDQENNKNNSGKPYYAAELIKIEGIDATLKLTPEEAAEVDGVPAKFKGEFKISAGLVEESS
jgi:hypothetical protein